MIITVTFSPALDYAVDLETFEIGAINRAYKEKILPGGKGINVSRVLKHLGVDSVATGFLAGFIGSYIDNCLKAEGINTDFVYVDGITRVNWKVKSPVETAIDGVGPTPTEEDIEALFQKIYSYGPIDENGKKNLVCFCSRFPKRMTEAMFDRYFSELNRLGIPFMVDAYGDTLMRALKYGPELIKPNEEETEDTLHEHINSIEGFKNAARRFVRLGAKNAIVSLGAKGAIISDKEGVCEFVPCPKGKTVNTVGSGDSMVAGYVYGFEKSFSTMEKIQLAVCCGSASAFSEDLANGKEIEALLIREFPSIKL